MDDQKYRPVIIFSNSVPQQKYDTLRPNLEQLPEIETESVNTTPMQSKFETYADLKLQDDRCEVDQGELARQAEISIDTSNDISHTWSKLRIKAENTLIIPAKV